MALQRDCISGQERMWAPDVGGGTEVGFQYEWGAAGRSRLWSGCSPGEKLEAGIGTGSEAPLATLTSD